jgi:HK97 family phage portal protein
MRLFGFDIIRSKDMAAQASAIVGDRGSWWFPAVRESFTGAWQRNVEIRAETVIAYNAVFACTSLISGDIAKLRWMLMQQDSDGIWTETTSPAFSPVLRRPNRYQNRIKFLQQWIISKLVHGNTYVLIERDARQVVTALYVLDPARVRVLVAPDGGVYYELRRDFLAGVLDDTIRVPASEIIHDVMMPLHHPLIGVSPIYACGLAATQGMRILNNSVSFFGNNSQPGGILTAPGTINEETADRIKEHWEEKFAGQNIGRVAVMGDGLEFKPMAMTAVDAQLIDQLKLSAETVCSCYHVPPHMIAVGPTPAYNNIEALSQAYYTQCLQELIESLELSLKEGLGLPNTYDIRLDLDALLRMDTATQYKSIADGIRGGFLSPNEGRQKVNLGPVAGGESPMMQHQDYSLAALAKRDAMADPFGIIPAPGGTPKPGDATATDPLPSAEQPPAKVFDAAAMRQRVALRAYTQLGLLDAA